MITLTDPNSPELLNKIAPKLFRVQFETSVGNFTVEAHRSWSPLGVDRFYNLVKHHFFDNTRIFRVVPKFVAQFGVSGDPRISKIWKNASISDEPVKESNTRGMISYAMDEFPNSRSTQIYINYSDNSRLDKNGFTPFAKVIEGIEVTEKFYDGYGKAFDEQDEIEEKGNDLLDKDFPKLSKIINAKICKE